MQLFIRHGKMTEEHGTLTAFGVIFASWAVVFFGVWTLPASDSVKIVLDAVTTISFFTFGYSYFAYKKILPLPSSETKDKILFWIWLVNFIISASTSFTISLSNWEITRLDGVPVVTFNNLFSAFYFVIFCISIYLIYSNIRNKNPYRKKIAKSSKH